MELNQDNKRRLISAGITALFTVFLFILLLSLSLPYLDPPPPETGVEIGKENLTDIEEYDGYADVQGGGQNQIDPSPTSNNDEDYSITQNTESVLLKAKSTKKTPKIKPKQTQPTVDNNALFKKGSVKSGGSGTSKGLGDGDKFGDGSGNGNHGSGTGTNGASFSLNGRGSKSLSKPKTNKDETGNVVVEIKVDQQGNVVEAHAGARGTTLMNTNIWRTCEQAAKKSKFTEKPNAPELQRGTITYKFVR